jgi:ADP-ribose pyrophosphatase YjhB (NUDIX family)
MSLSEWHLFFLFLISFLFGGALKDEKHKTFVACYLILRKEGKLLLLRRVNTGYEDGNYTLVSGHIEAGETAMEAMKREALEEAGIEIEIGDMRVVHVEQRKSPDREYVDFYLMAKQWKGEPRNMEPDKCSDLRWFDEKELPKNIISYIPVVIKKVDAGEPYSAYGY